MNINNKKKTFLLIGILVLTMLIVSGGTFAYFRWISSEDQQTNLAIQIEENISMHIENSALTKAGMHPTNTCTNEAATMSGVSIIALENQTGVIARPKFKLRVKITDKDGNVITNNSAGSANSDNPYRYFINYAVAEENGTCTEPLYSGNFDQNEPTYQGQTQWYDSEWITLTSENTGFPLISNGQDSGVSFNGTPYQTTYHNYKVWVWIDESYTSVNTGDVVSDKLQDAKIELSWSENSTVQQIKAQAYAVFSSSAEGGDDSLRFYQSDEPITEDSTYAGRPVTAVYTGFETENYNGSEEIPWSNIKKNIKTVVFEDTITPISTERWFNGFNICTYIDVIKLDTSNVTSMVGMFMTMGIDATTITIEGMENWDTSKVTNMTQMFEGMGYSSQTINISDISGWDVSNVTNMDHMFFCAGVMTTNDWSLDLSEWNVYKVTSYYEIDVPSKSTPPNWYTSYAVYSEDDNSLRFYRTTTDLTQETTWNGKTITKVHTGFENDTSGFVPWNGPSDATYANSITSVVVEDEIYPTSLEWWFGGMTKVSSIDVTKLNTSNVQYMNRTFFNTGSDSSVSVFNIIGLENWNTSNVTNLAYTFSETGKNATTFNISNISHWNTSNVTNMDSTFNNMGLNSTNNWTLNLSSWNVDKLDGRYNSFNTGVEDKVIAPTWVN